MRLFLIFAGILLCGAKVCAFDPEALRQSRESWRRTADHHDRLMADIRNRPSNVRMFSEQSPAKTAAQYQAELQGISAYWARQNAARAAYNEEVERFLRRNREIEAQNAVIRAKNAAIEAQRREFLRQKEAAKPGEYARFLEIMQGLGTRKMPPSFADERARFDWHLQEAQGGDKWAAFWVGRALLTGIDAPKAPLEGARWLEKSGGESPAAAAWLGATLVRGEFLPRDTKRGLELLEKAALADQSGEAAWLFGTLLAEGLGVPPDVDRAAQMFCLAFDRRGEWATNTLWDEYGWSENTLLRRRREQTIEAQTRAFVEKHLDRVGIWLDSWGVSSGISQSEAGRGLGAILDRINPKVSQSLAQKLLDFYERPDAPPYSTELRRRYLESLLSFNDPDAPTRALLAVNGEFYEWPTQKRAELWRENAATLERWARENGALKTRARWAILAYELGFFPAIPAVATPQSLDARWKTWGEDSSKFPAFPQPGALKSWLDAVGLEWGLAVAPPMWGNPLQQLEETRQKLAATGENFSAATLQEARANFEKAQKAVSSRARFGFWLQALEGGDALAAWRLACWHPSASDRQWLVDLADARFRRDVTGNDENAATAAMGLHVLHTESRGNQPYGRTIGRYFRVSKPSATDWKAVAIAKKHPWALNFSQTDAAQKARNKFGWEDQKIWPWLAENAPIFEGKTALWRRDCDLFDFESPAFDIAELQAPLAAIRAAQADADAAQDIIARLPAAREICDTISRPLTPQSRQKANQLFGEALDLDDLDRRDEQRLLPQSRAQTLELLVQSALEGHALAPLEIGKMLQKPGFPMAAQPTEARAWFQIAKTRMAQSVKSDPIPLARENAENLVKLIQEGEIFPKDDAQILQYARVAAQMGNQELALMLAYESGTGPKANPAESQKWEKIAADIGAGRHKIPPSLLTGRSTL